jgi:peptidoglycan-associated lipoprotein
MGIVRITPVIFALTLALLLGACGTPGNVVVLLPDDQGRVGQVTVQGKQGATRSLSSANQATALDGAGSVLTLSQAEITGAFGSALSAEPTPARHFVLYFTSDGTDLRPESLAELPSVLDEIHRRTAPTVVVVGHSDHYGPESYNNTLARARAQAVRQLVIDAGVAPDMITVESYGYHVPLVPTPPETREPRNRRVEIGVR